MSTFKLSDFLETNFLFLLLNSWEEMKINFDFQKEAWTHWSIFLKLCHQDINDKW